MWAKWALVSLAPGVMLTAMTQPIPHALVFPAMWPVCIVMATMCLGCGSTTPSDQNTGPQAPAVMDSGAQIPGAATAEAADSETAISEPTPPMSPVSRGKAIIHTSEGPITVTFFPEVAPKTAAHIAALMEAGCYEGVNFFRLEPNFVVQVAAVADADCHPNAMSTVPGEFSPSNALSSTSNVAKHTRLALSMARWEDVDSGTSSWSIMLGAAPSMDGQYTVFGRVIEGEATIAKIEAIGSKPGEHGMKWLNRPVAIERVELVEPVGTSAGASDGLPPAPSSAQATDEQ